MSNFRAIATVTKALDKLLLPAAQEAVSGALIHTGRPEAPVNGGAAGPGIDLFLYQVMPNAALRNSDLATRRGDGTIAQRPKAALDLHYLLTFHGDEARLEPQRLLGNAVRALHANPVLLRSDIASVIADPALDYLTDSDLDDAVESVKLTQLPLSLEELSKLWSVFFQIPYNLSVAYQATVVVIEGRERAAKALPVAARRVYVTPFNAPVIDDVEAASGGAIVAGATLVLTGRNLKRQVTRVSVRGVEVDPASVSDTELRVPLTVPPFAAADLRAGVQGVYVVHPLPMGVPPVEHAGFESNVAAFVLRPRITAASAPNSTHVNVTVDPPLRAGQRAVLLLNGVSGAAPPAHVFENRVAAADASVIAFQVSGVAAGQYFVRAQVDGAESPLVLDPAALDFGPTVTVP